MSPKPCVIASSMMKAKDSGRDLRGSALNTKTKKKNKMNENQNNNNNAVTKTPPPGGYRPKFKLYHANVKGTGGAIQMALHPAHDDTDGSLWVTLASQKTVGNSCSPNPTFSTFDWETAMNIKLDFTDLTQILQVFRGEKESINDDHGLYHRGPSYNTIIKFHHQLEPFAGYVLELYRSTRGRPDEDRSGYFFFNSAEALGISIAIENMLGVICFGIPKVVPHDTSAYKRDVREMRNAAAA